MQRSTNITRPPPPPLEEQDRETVQPSNHFLPLLGASQNHLGHVTAHLARLRDCHYATFYAMFVFANIRCTAFYAMPIFKNGSSMTTNFYGGLYKGVAPASRAVITFARL
jgi:hypothetical protein